MVNGHQVVSVRAFRLGDGLHIDDLHDEIVEMTDILLGRQPPPIDTGISTMMEVAEAFHARAREIELHLHHDEAAGHTLKGSRAYRFRTGELRSFIELVSKSMDLGSRRITALQIELEHRG